MAKAEKLNDTSLKALLAAEIRSAIVYDDSELSEKRATAMEYYRGEMTDVPALSGRSSVVSRDTADVITWMLPGIMRVFMASDQMAEFEPVGTEDEQAAEDAGKYINYVFMKDNPGYRIVYTGTHDSLLHGNGVIKHWWDDKEECDYSDHSGLTEADIAILQQDEGVEIIGQSPGDPQAMEMPGEDGQPIVVEVPTYDIKVKRVILSGKVKVEAIEPENLLLDRHARFLEEARFTAHRDEVSRSDLIEMGFDKTKVDNLPSDNLQRYTEEAIARDPDELDFNDVGDRSTQLIELYECYVKADADGDGISETIRAYYAGNAGAGELLDWEVYDDDMPFTDIPCEPVPHKWEARSIFDQTEDMQKVKTVLWRQLLDNLYASNLPMREMEEGSIKNPDQLVNPKFGGLIIRKKGSPATEAHEVPFVADKAFTALEYADQVIERRTGVSRSTMALDPDVLNNQTATASQNQRDAAYSQIEIVARNQAELGWRRVFKAILRLVIKHQKQERIIRLNGRPMRIDPRPWNANMDATINIGLGSGSRDRDMAMLNNILGHQVMLADRLTEGGFGDKVVDMAPLIRNTLVKIAESAGLKNPEAYYPELDEEDTAEMKRRITEQQNQGDPKVALEQSKAQAQMQMDQQKMQANAVLEQAKMELERQKAAAAIETERQKAEQDAALKLEQMQAEMALKAEQLNAELDLKRYEIDQRMAVQRELGVANAASKMNGGTSGVHMGGDPG